MKSIQQNCQLSEEELKSVFRKDGEEFSELLVRNIDFSKIRNDLSGLADGILKKTKQAFQILLEKIIAEEFFDFLEDIEKEGGDSSRNGYYTRKRRTYLGDFDIQIPRARYERFQTALLGKYKHSIGDIEEKVLQLYLGGMSEAEVVDAIANTNGIGISREKVGQIVRSTLGEATEFNSRPIKDCPVVFMDLQPMFRSREVSWARKASKRRESWSLWASIPTETRKYSAISSVRPKALTDGRSFSGT